MFLSFKHKSSQKQQIENTAQDRIATSIVHKCIKVQEQCGTFMQHQTERLSGRVKKFMIVIFFLLSGGYSLYLIAESLISHKSKPLSIAPIKVPEHTGKSGNENTKAPVIVSKAEYEKIRRFRFYMDSLARSPSGKKVYDSILNQRPGLMDSVLFIENIYQLQIKK